jgi:hypothetical protein
MLDAASAMKARGELPEKVALWATANPVVEEDAAYTAAKVWRGDAIDAILA